MKRILTMMMMLVLSVALFAGIPHPVFVEYDGAPVSFEAYLGTDEGTILTESSVGCGILGDYNLVMVECGNFPEWEFADVLYIVLTYGDDSNQWYDVILDYDNVQALTEITWYDGTPGGEVVQEGVFAAGWNLWSYNVQLASNAVEDVFGPMTYLTKVKSITESYDPALDPMFNTLVDLVDGQGYWVQVSEADVLDLTGAPLPLSTTLIDLSDGWNLAGFVPQINYEVEYAFAELITASQLVKVKSITESYDPALDPMFNTLEILYPGKGYWVEVNADVVGFTYPANPARGAYEEAACNYIWTPVIYTNSTCAYGYTTANEGYVGAFVDGECRGIADVREGTLSFVINGEDIEEVSFELYQNGIVYDADATLTTNPGFDVSGFELDFTGFVPVSTRLISAYPNPFNPETTIAYEVAEAGNVNVSIYNVKGQKIAELENCHKETGQYNVVWKADAQASGVYFIRMNAAGTDQIQKVILMK